MKARVFSCHAPETELQDLLSEWLQDPKQNDIRIENVFPISQGDPSVIVIFYSDRTQSADMRRRVEEVMCGQCKRQPAIEGLKVCEECREYQKDYRKKRKQEKTNNRYP